jgi:hypothetical protein
MGISGIAALRAAKARGQRVTEGNDPRGVEGEQHPGGVGASLPGGVVIAGKVLDDPFGDGGQIDMRCRDETLGRGRQAPGGRRQVRLLPGGQGDELIQQVRQILGPQVRLQHRQEPASVHGSVTPQNGTRGPERLAGRAVTGPDKNPQGLESGRVGCVGGQFEQGVHQDGAEQLRRTPGCIDDLPGSPGLLRSRRTSPGLGTVDAVQCLSEITDHMALAGQKLAAALAALAIAPGPLIGSLFRRRLPGRFRDRALACHGGQVWQLTRRGRAVRAPDAIGLVELDGKLQSLMSLRPGRRGVLAADLKRAHREAEH